MAASDELPRLITIAFALQMRQNKLLLQIEALTVIFKSNAVALYEGTAGNRNRLLAENLTYKS
jgi:hypothetical protein